MKPLYTSNEIFNLIENSDNYDDLLNIIEVLKLESSKYSLLEYSVIMDFVEKKTDEIYLSELN